MDNEVWKDIKNYEGLYQISNKGNVRSVNRVYFQKSSHNTYMYKKYKGKMLAKTDNGNGYLIVHLLKNGKRKPCYVHRLVAEHFILNPNNYNEVNHKDFNKKNNNINNLEWVSRKINVNYSIKNMQTEKTKCKASSTGEKYITKKNNYWRLNIQRKELKIDKLYKTYDEALQAKEMMLSV